MAIVRYEANLTPEQFNLFSKFLKEVREMQEKDEHPTVLSEIKPNEWIPSNNRK